MPDTDFAGMLDSLCAAENLDFNFVTGRHCGLEKRDWVRRYRKYLEDLRDAAHRIFKEMNGEQLLPGEDGVRMTERVFNEICRAAA